MEYGIQMYSLRDITGKDLDGALKAVAEMALPAGARVQISLDHPMCCGIGACFACVVKVRDDASPDGWRYSRSCLEGPVYDARDVVWE